MERAVNGRKREPAVWLTLMLAVMVVAGACAPQPATIEIGYVNWAEGVAMSYLMEQVLEKHVNVKVELTQADVAPIFAGVAEGDLDFFMDTWLPLTHASYIDEYGDQVDNYGTNYEGARIGLVVPEYVTIDSIEELNAHADRFDGKIVGIDAGAGVMRTTEEAIGAYGLDLTLSASSGPAMTAALSRRVEAGEWIVVTGWTPHWMFAKWDLRFLEDPKEIYGEAENIYTIARQGFDEDHEDVAQVLKNFFLTDPQLAGLESYMQEGPDEPTAAERWMNDNTELVQSWLP